VVDLGSVSGHKDDDNSESLGLGNVENHSGNTDHNVTKKEERHPVVPVGPETEEEEAVGPDKLIIERPCGSVPDGEEDVDQSTNGVGTRGEKTDKKEDNVLTLSHIAVNRRHALHDSFVVGSSVAGERRERGKRERGEQTTDKHTRRVDALVDITATKLVEGIVGTDNCDRDELFSEELEDGAVAGNAISTEGFEVEDQDLENSHNFLNGRRPAERQTSNHTERLQHTDGNAQRDRGGQEWGHLNGKRTVSDHVDTDEGHNSKDDEEEEQQVLNSATLVAFGLTVSHEVTGFAAGTVDVLGLGGTHRSNGGCPVPGGLVATGATVFVSAVISFIRSTSGSIESLPDTGHNVTAVNSVGLENGTTGASEATRAFQALGSGGVTDIGKLHVPTGGADALRGAGTTFTVRRHSRGRTGLGGGSSAGSDVLTIRGTKAFSTAGIGLVLT